MKGGPVPVIQLNNLLRETNEIIDILDWAIENVKEEINAFPDRSYEQGVINTLRWITGITSQRPDE